MTAHLLMVGAWPELTSRLIGLPARVSLMQLPGQASCHDATWTHRLIEVDYRDRHAALVAARQIERADPIDVVVGFREAGLPAVATIASTLNKSSAPGPARTLGRDKHAVRSILNTCCHPIAHRLCADAADLAGFAAALGRAAIVKPVDGAGSVGVHFVHQPTEAATAWEHACAAAGPGPKLAEEFLTGPEFSLELRSLAGTHEVVAITRKETTGPPHFVETGHAVPACIDLAQQREMVAEAVSALNGLGHRHGPSHIEIISTDDGPRIVEVNRRLGGDRIWELVLLAHNRDLMRESLEDAISIVQRDPVRSASIRYHTSPDAIVAGPDTVRAQSTTSQPKSAASPLRSSHDRSSYDIVIRR